MVTHSHEVPIRLFQDRPELAAELLVKTVGATLPPYAAAESESEALTNCDPLELNCDNVAVFRDRFGNAVHAIITEIQRSDDADKWFSWPMYLTILRARLRCQVRLLVVCTDEVTATWARKPIRIGPPEFILRPDVIGPGDLVRLIDGHDTREAVELLILVAATYGKGPQTEAVAHDLGRRLNELSDPDRKKYAGLAWQLLSNAACDILEGYMSMTYQEYLETPAGQLELKGEARGRAEAVLDMFQLRGIEVSEDSRERILACAEPEQLKRWFNSAFSAARAEDLFD
ncbi:hypothetical protein [Glycomyces paridis]|uniref:Uncharacterized protein n=1 Tax=Glycomyces paridis TaxID=2126555 RepID=A0A4S8PGC6_9ACTN|nr:hypothetical protein [Glycomyces paridis]THV28665.1 hypothetical protein E9998_11150 [Glycomyces paridis]